LRDVAGDDGELIISVLLDTVIKEIQIDSDDFDIYELWEKGISMPE
jgi:hypothetical protein